MSSSRNYRVNGPHDVPAIESAVQTSTTKIIESSQEAPVLIERILHFDNLPHWMQTDPHIKYGYRQELRGFAKCFWSLFYVHNEFVNTWSHLLPGVFFLALFLGTGYSILYGTAEFSKIDHLVIQIYVAGTAACLLLSAFFHGTNAHSEAVARRCLKLDYLGIVLTISTTCVSATFFGLHGQTHLQIPYISFTVVCAVAVFRAVLHPEADGPKAAEWRAAVFIALASSGFMPIVHVALAEGSRSLEWFPLSNIAVTCGSYLIGTTFYVYRLPEKQFPGTFDFWGASHQIFHILVAFGQIVHLFGLKRVMLMHYQ